MPEAWQEAAEAKRASILAAIPKEWRIDVPSIEDQPDVTEYIKQFLTEDEIEITELAAEDLVGYASRWSAEEVARAFCHRAALAHQLTNCLHEIFFDSAIEDAKKLDEYLKSHRDEMGPLHGVPISLKDQFHVKGVETSMGYVGWLNTFEGRKNTGKEKTYESLMVEELRKAGAILYCKTSVPHTLMSGETVNNIIGYTTNPKNRRLAAGGSSGGEGALIGLKGSPVGFGTDIGGSIRIPAAFNGLYGLRPSVGRLPYEGMANSMDGQNSVLSVVGPLSTTIGGLKLVTKSLVDAKPWLKDPMCVEIPWRSEAEKEINELSAGTAEKKLCFGVLRSDGVCNVQPPIKRAVDVMVQKLKEQGHEVIEWTPPSHKELLDEGMKSWIFDGGKDVKSAFALSGEPMAEQVSFFNKVDTEFTASEISATNVKLRQIKKQYLDYWNATEKETGTGRPVDAVISPVAPFPAARREGYGYYGYTTWVNVLDYTSVVVPVLEVDRSVDGVDGGYEALDETDRKVQESYDPEIYHGAHVSLQLVGRRLQEERMLAIADYVRKVLGK